MVSRVEKRFDLLGERLQALPSIFAAALVAGRDGRVGSEARV